MPSIGISPLLANRWLGTFGNVPCSFPAFCAQLHVGIPGVAGVSNPAAITARKAVTLTVPTGGGIALTGTPPTWNEATSEILSHLSFWSGFDGDLDAEFLLSAAVRLPQSVANGDLIILNADNIIFPSLTLAS